MEILVKGIDLSSPVLVWGTIPAYWIDFTSEMTAGRALLVLAPERVQGGQSIWVETGQEAISGLRILTLGEVLQAQCVPLDRPGDYFVAGRVANITPHGDDKASAVIDVEAAGFWFALANDDFHPVQVRAEDWVSFTVHQLSLWDEGL